MMAVADGKPVIDLPGPTLAAYYGSEWCLQAIVARMLGVPVHRHPTVTATVAADFSSVPVMANIGRLDVVRENEGYVAHYYNFKGGQLAECMTSNAQRVSPIGEAGFPAGTEIEVELLRGEEFVEEA